MRNLVIVLSPFILSLFIVILLSFWTDRTLDFWVSYLKHSQVDVPFWISFLVTFVGNGIVLVLNLISEIARLII